MPDESLFALTGRRALVTGGSRGIGAATARMLARAGADVAITCRTRKADADAVAAEVSSLGRRSSVHQVELADRKAVDAMVQGIASSWGGLDILVGNHARSGGDGPLGTLDAAMLDGHWAVNTRSTILLVQAFAARHDGRPGGRIVLMTSGQDLGPMGDEVAYAASKGALASITRTLADQLADRAITVNAVNPGPVDTGYPPAEVRAAVQRRFPQRRWGTPDDPARLIAWLATDDALWITGQVINTEGGFRRWG